MTEIVTKNLGINAETGLEEILRVWSVNINADTEVIEVMYRIYEILPTAMERQVSEKTYYRYNSETNKAFDNWRNSPIGQGITQAIDATLNNYPNLEQQD
jgi:hypothetical protein